MATPTNNGRRSKPLDNATTKFSKFTWADCSKLREAIDEVRQKMNGKLPARFKVKL